MSADKRAPAPDDLAQQAWDWLHLLSSGQADEEDGRQFRLWLHSSGDHQAAYRQVKQRWDAFKPAAGIMLGASAEAAGFHRRTLRGPQIRIGRRAFLGAAIGAAAAAGVAVAYPPFGMWAPPQEWNADYRTAVGEQRTLALADRVSVTLNTRTSVRRRLAGARTVGLDLIAGEAAIDLNGTGLPFAVAAGAGRSTAQAGRFEVRYLDGKVCVTCIDGAVRVDHPAGVRLLQARQQAVYDEHAVGAAAGVDPEDVAAWRGGELVFRKVRLAEAIAEINRYRAGRVVLMNAAAGGKAVSGRFAIASLDLALLQLQHVFNLDARSLPGGVTILS